MFDCRAFLQESEEEESDEALRLRLGSLRRRRLAIREQLLRVDRIISSAQGEWDRRCKMKCLPVMMVFI